MPDCVADYGKLEHLLKTLVPANDPVWARAEACTDAARVDGASFSDPDRIKAVVHCWLAWQSAPGTPFGTAIKAHFFSHDSKEARAFLRWMQWLFGLGELAPRA